MLRSKTTFLKCIEGRFRPESFAGLTFLTLWSGCHAIDIEELPRTEFRSDERSDPASQRSDGHDGEKFEERQGARHRDAWYRAGRAELERKRSYVPNRRRAKNIILFLGDGMGVSTQTAARIYEGQTRGESGEENRLSFEAFPHVGLSKTYNVNQQIPDSAGTMTAIMTGSKTNAGVVGVNSHSVRGDCDSIRGNKLQTLLELAESKCKRDRKATGIVTTTRLTHATPASTYAHAADRNWEDDKDLPESALAAGCKDIAAQLIDFSYGDGIDVAMGGGRRSFIPAEMADPEDVDKTGERQDGRDLTQEWLDSRSRSAYVWNKEQFDAINPRKTRRLLGLFNRSHMRYEHQRESDTAGEPSLSEMTAKAIDILSKNRRGFILVVESGRIDHGHHNDNAFRALNETIEFSNAVQTAVEKTNPRETLIVVTADHSHGMTMTGWATRGNPILGKSIENDSMGEPEEAHTLAEDGLPITTLSYADGPGGWMETIRPDTSRVDTESPDYTQQATFLRTSGSAATHGGEDVAIMATGPRAYLFDGIVEQNFLFHALTYASGL